MEENGANIKIGCQVSVFVFICQRWEMEVQLMGFMRLKVEIGEDGLVASQIQSLLCYKTTYFHYILILQIIDQDMSSKDLYQDDLTILMKARDYKCPCGKTYLSYAALFTHIKQKHQGKPPGKITKPPSIHPTRGRPPVKPKIPQQEQEKGLETDIPPASHQPLFPPQTQDEKIVREESAERAISELAQLLDSMPQQQLNKEHLNEIEVFSQMNVYLNTRMGCRNMAKGNICMADGFVEFAQNVCEHILWRNFEPLYLLFMLFLQYMVDEQNTKKILTESNLDLFCEYINEFVEEHAREMAEYYQLQNLWIMQKQNSIKVFYHFFQWCTSKRYITYKINLTKEMQHVAKECPPTKATQWNWN